MTIKNLSLCFLLFTVHCLLLTLPLRAHISDDSGDGRQLFSYYTSSAPTIDGKLNTWAAEWGEAYVRNITIKHAASADTYDVTLMLKNDGSFLYVGVAGAWGSNSALNYCRVYLDQYRTGVSSHNDTLDASAVLEEYYVQVNRDSAVEIDGGWTGAAWQQNATIGTGFETQCTLGGGSTYNYEYKIPLNGGTPDANNGYLVSRSSTGELGINIEIWNTNWSTGDKSGRWNQTNMLNTSAATGNGWGDLKLGILSPDRQVSALYANSNVPTVADGNIATDTGWEGAFEKDIVLTNFGVAGTDLQTYNATLYLKDDGANPDFIYVGLEIVGAAAADQVDLFFDYATGGAAPRNQDYVLTNNGENAVRLINNTFSDRYFTTAPSWDTADGTADDSGDDGTSGSKYGFEFKIDKAGADGNSDLQIGRNGKTGFLIKFTKGGVSYWWNRFANISQVTSTDPGANYLAAGWCSLQSGGAYVVPVLPAEEATIGDGAYPITAQIIPFPTYSINGVTWRLENQTTEQGVSPYNEFTSSLTKSGDTNFWSGNIVTNNPVIADGTDYRIVIKVTDSNNVEIKKYISLNIDNSVAGGASNDPATVTITSPSEGAVISGRRTLSFNVTPQSTLTTNNSLISVDGSAYTYTGITQPASGGGAGSYVFYSTNAVDGAHIFRVRALDSNGTTGYSETRLIIVDNTNPTLSPAGQNSAGAIYISNLTHNIARNGDVAVLCVSANDFTSSISTVIANASALGSASINLMDSGPGGSGIPNDLTAGDKIYSSSITINAALGLTGWATFYFSGADTAGNTTSGIMGYINIDNSSPTVSIGAPLSTTVSSVTAGGTLDVTFSYNESNSYYILIEAYDNGGQIVGRKTFEMVISTYAVNRTETIPISETAAEGLGSISVLVIDKASNQATSSSANSVLIDNTKPIIQAGTPLGGSIINDNTPLVTALFYETGSGINTAACLVRVDGSTVPAIVTGSSVTYQAGILTDGAHTVSIDVRDIAGNQADTLVWNFTVDTIAPQTVSVGRITPSYYSAASSVTYIKGTIEVEAIAGDGVYLSSVTFYDDSGAKGVDNTSPYTFSWAPAEGERTIYVLAYDSMSNVSQSRILNVVCDNTAPVAQVLAPLAASKQSSRANNNVAVRYQYTESNPSSVLIRIYNNAGTEVGRKELTTGLTGGSVDRWDNVEIISTAGEGTDYDVYVQMTDRVGQSGNDNEADVVIIDNTVPVITVNAPAGGSIISNNRPTIRADYSDSGGSGINTGSVKFLIDGVDFSGLSDVAATYVSTVPINALSEGVHTVLLEVSDNSGNKASQVSWGFTVDTTRPQTVSVGRITPAYYVQGSSITYIKGTIEVEAIAGDGVYLSSVTFYENGVSTGVAMTAPYTFSWAPAEGERSIYIIAYDSMSNVTQSGTVNVICDNTVPAKANIFYPSTGSFISGVAGIKFDVADNYGISRVELYDNSILSGEQKYSVKSSTGEFVYNTWTVSDGTHTLKITAYDNTGNSLDSANVTITVDNTIPVVAIQPLLSPTSGQVRISYTYTETNVSYAELYIDGSLVQTDSSVGASPEFFIWYSTNNSDGGHILSVKLYDRAGNSALSEGKAIIIDNYIPQSGVIALISPKYTVESSTLSYIKGTVTIEAAVSDTVNIAKVEYFRDGGTSLGVDTSAPWSINWNTAGLDGHHTLYIVVTDTGSNTLTSAVVPVIVDNTVPAKANIFYPAAGSFIKGVTGIKYDFSDTYGVSRAELYDNSVLSGEQKFSVKSSTGEFAYDSRAVSDGAHTMKITAYDNTGNSLDSSNVAITVDNTAPVVAIQPLLSPTSGQVRIGYTYTEANVSYAELYIDGSLVQTDSSVGASPEFFVWYSTNNSDGGHILSVKLYDRAGNSTLSEGKAIIIDNYTPQSGVIAIISPKYTVEGSTLSYIKGSVTIEAAVSDTVNVAKVEFFRDGGISLGIDTSAPWSINWNTAALDGHHTLYIVVTDTGTNTLTSSVVSVIVDNTAPTVTLNPVTTPTKYPNQLLTGNYTETNLLSLTVNGVEVEKVSGKDWTWQYSFSLSPGENYFTVTVKDKAFNTVTATATISGQSSIYFDPNAPIGFITPRPGAILKGTVTIECFAPDVATDVTAEISPDKGLNWYNLAGTLYSASTDTQKTDGWKFTWDTANDNLPDGTSFFIRLKAYNREASYNVPGSSFTWTLLASDILDSIKYVDNIKPYFTAYATSTLISAATNTLTYSPPLKIAEGLKESYVRTQRIKFITKDEISGVDKAQVTVEASESGFFGKTYYSEFAPADDGEAIQYLPLYEGENRISVRVLDKAGNISDNWSEVIYYRVPKESALMLKNSSGTLSSPDGTKIEVPEQALVTDTRLSITPVSSADLIKPLNLDIKLVPVARDFGPEGTLFNRPVTITLPFTEADLDTNRDGIINPATEFDLAKLEIFFWDGREWIKVGRKDLFWDSSSKQGWISAEVNHFTIYTVAQYNGAAPDKFKMYLTKNPFPQQEMTTFVYALPAAGKITINIFDMAGDLIYSPAEELSKPAGKDSLNWNGNNKFGRYVGSGVYFYIFKYVPEDGSATVTKKGTIGVIK